MRRMRAALAAGAVAAAVSAAPAVPSGSADDSAVFKQGSAVAQLRGADLALRSAPGSARVLAGVSRTTEFGSATPLPVVAFRGRWIEVISTKLPNGVHGYVRLDHVWLKHDALAVDVDLSQRLLRVWRHGVVVRRTEVAIGAPGSS